MGETKTHVFNTYLALTTWLNLRKPFVKVMSIQAPMFDVGYDLPYRMNTPGITVTYLEFPAPE